MRRAREGGLRAQRGRQLFRCCAHLLAAAQRFGANLLHLTLRIEERQLHVGNLRAGEGNAPRGPRTRALLPTPNATEFAAAKTRDAASRLRGLAAARCCKTPGGARSSCPPRGICRQCAKASYSVRLSSCDTAIREGRRLSRKKRTNFRLSRWYNSRIFSFSFLDARALSCVCACCSLLRYAFLLVVKQTLQAPPSVPPSCFFSSFQRWPDGGWVGQQAAQLRLVPKGPEVRRARLSPRQRPRSRATARGRDLSEATLPGSIISLVAMFLMVVLFFLARATRTARPAPGSRAAAGVARLPHHGDEDAGDDRQK